MSDCPDGAVCQSCPCAAEDDACFPGERLRAERDRYRKALEEIVPSDGASWTWQGSVASEALREE